jgi:hypothetical protein
MRHIKQRQPYSQWQRTLRRWQRWIAAYFQCEGRLWLWFGSALVGVLAKSFFEVNQAGQSNHLSWPHVTMALVATLVTFQTTFERYQEAQVSTPLLVQICLAFQSGFFWQTVFNDLTGVK